MDGRIKVLCIEDEVAVADYIASLLDNTLYKVEIIYDGKEALEYLLSTVERPDIILLDYILPSLDGIQILKALNANKKYYPVIFLTAVETIETAVAAMKEGALDYLTKSVYLKDELNIKIEKVYLAYKEHLKKEYYEERLSMFSMAVDQSPNCIEITDINGNVEYVNKTFTQHTGYTSDEVLGKNLRILKTDHHPITYYERLWRTISSGKTWKGEFVNRKKNGELFYEFATIKPIKNKQGEIISYLGIKEDVTEHKKSEHALRESEKRFRSIFEMANAGIFFADQNGLIVMVNKAFQEMTGYNSDELLDIDFNQITHPEDRDHESELLKELLFNEIKQYRIEKRYVSKTGTIIWTDLAVTVIHDEKNNPISYVGVAKDITLRKEYEQKLEAMIATKDKFFSIISHDIRNQFASLLGLTEIMKGSVNKKDSENLNKLIDLLHFSGRQAFEMLEDLLKWSRSQINRLELKKETINLFELTENVLLLLNNQANLKNIELVCNVNRNHIINADKQMISTVLRNLVNNAIKFTPNGGRIIVSGKVKTGKDIFSVKDNGVGMSPLIKDKIFRIDTRHSTPGTEKETGTGLGLILCKEFIDKHGGSIIVNSEEGLGSEFIISLPQ
jgi:PAS domain S-box